MYYAQIDLLTRICHAVTETHSQIIAPDMIERPSLDTSVLGKRHDEITGEFEAVAPPANPCEWLIDHGPLLDRFGTAIKMRFLKSTDPDVVALRQDFYGRKWLDLKNPELKGGFYFMAGVTVPVLGTIAAPITGLTTSLVDTVFSTPVDPKDNQALRKLYF